jgi:hypothetical protein
MPKTKTKTLTRAEVKRIEAGRSSYGCGANECMACYPLEYACEYCAVDFDIPIRNGEAYVCEACGWDRFEDIP